MQRQRTYSHRLNQYTRQPIHNSQGDHNAGTAHDADDRVMGQVGEDVNVEVCCRGQDRGLLPDVRRRTPDDDAVSGEFALAQLEGAHSSHGPPDRIAADALVRPLEEYGSP